MAKSIPDRWSPYSACGSIIEGTRIVCFKVPLSRAVQVNKKEIKEIWDVKALLNIPNLGAVIDLTNTNRYYDPGELREAGVLHKKILIPGREIPPEKKVKEFMNACAEFLALRSDMTVGVHCTHGLNRTGYMVCRYMRDRMQIPAKEAIEKFEKARGYHIERENFLADLLGQKVPPPDVGLQTNLKPVEAPQYLRITTNSRGDSSKHRSNIIKHQPQNSVNEERGSSRRRFNNYCYDYKYDY